MKVLFTTKMLQDRNFQPLGIYHLSAALKQRGHETFLVDAISIDLVKKAIEEVRPDVLAVSTPTTRYPFFRELCFQIRAGFPDLFVVVGGVHTILVPEAIMDQGVDAVSLGEGDYSLPELVDRIRNKEDITTTKGFWIKQDGNVYRNSIADPIENLDELPYGDRDIQVLFSAPRMSTVEPFATGRGCPFQCTFCCNSALKDRFGHSGFTRWYSPTRVVDEVRFWSQKHGYRRISFMSEIFAPNKKWLEQFAGLYRKEVGIEFWCMLHPSMIDKDKAGLLAQAGSVTVMLGIESGNEDLLKNVLNRPIRPGQIREAVKVLHEAGIKVQGTSILGLPGSDLEKDLETLDLNRSAHIDFPDACIYQPYPLTPLAQKAIEDGMFDGNLDSIGETFNPSAKPIAVVKTPHFHQIETLGYLFPLAVKSGLIRRYLPLLMDLPLRPVYHLFFKLSVSWFKLRYVVGFKQIFHRHFFKIFWTYFRT